MALFLIVAFVVSMIGFNSSLNIARANTVSSAQSVEEARITSLRLQLLHLQLQLAMLLQMKAERERASVVSPVSPSVPTRRSNNPHFMQVTTMAASAVGRNTAELQAKIDKGSSKYAELFFQYGTGNSLNLSSERFNFTGAREAAQKIRITNINPGTTYNYRAVLEDEGGDVIYGEIRSFTTVRQALTSTSASRPVVETEGVINITANTAEVKSFINMNNYDAGTVFYVKSLNSSDVSRINNYDNYDAIPIVRGESLTKQIVAKDVKERTTISGRISGMVKATKYYYRACVEYLDSRDNKNIACSNVESFVTTN